MVIGIFEMYTNGCFMTKQERKFTLGEVNTTMGAMGEVRFDAALLDVLSIKPGDFIVFTISKEGAVTVTGEKKTAQGISIKPATTPLGLAGLPKDITQPALFDAGQPTPKPSRQKRRTP
jgi:hypothetical protein